jgi:hypothetical protein
VIDFWPEGTEPPSRVSRGKVLAGLAAVLAAVIGLSTLVGYVAADKGFDWDLASVFGTALGTTLLALATFWLGFNTDQDVRASQMLARPRPNSLRRRGRRTDLSRWSSASASSRQ